MEDIDWNNISVDDMSIDQLEIHLTMAKKAIKSWDNKAIIGKAMEQIRKQLTKCKEQKHEWEDKQKKDNYKSQMVDGSMIYTHIVQYQHPMDRIENVLHNIMNQMGYTFYDGPIVESLENNFDKLNFPKDHPARLEHDTLYTDRENYILRTHTSNVQIHNLKNDVKGYTIGKVFRNDKEDMTHLMEFNQMEVFNVGNDINIAHMQSTVKSILMNIFNCNSLKFRFRPSYFPFTHFSMEIDIYYNNKWIEVAGCGMIHSNVLKECNVKDQRGFAIGIGVERIAMILNEEFTSVRQLYPNLINNNGEMLWN